MKRGINIGDFFENDYDVTKPFENPVPEWSYDAVCKAGFDHVRIPVRWSIWTDDANGYKINEKYAQEVENSVNIYLDNGLEVIINVHHFREAMDAPKENSEKLYAIWEQVAERFKGYSDKLIFEVMNEPTWRTTAEEWNEVQNECVKTIRKTNPTRKVMVCGIDYSGVFAMDDLVPIEDDNLIGTFHYYFPLEFTHQGAAWSPTYVDLRDVEWQGTDEEKANVVKTITEHAVAWSKKYGHPVNLGEFGVYGKYAKMEDRARWTDWVTKICEENDISWSYWELCRGFGCFEPDGTQIKPLIDALTNK